MVVTHATAILAASGSSADTATGVGIPLALAAGLVSFLSPCVLPLVPGYLSTVIGVAPADIQGAGARRVLGPSLLFIASFSLIFILLGLTATQVGSLLTTHIGTLRTVGGVLIVMMGVFVPRHAVRGRAQLPVAFGVADAPRRPRRAAARGRGVRGRVDPLHEHHARRDPHPGGGLELRRSRGAVARLLLRGPRDPLPADRARLRADDRRARGGQAPLPPDRGRRRGGDDRAGRC